MQLIAARGAGFGKKARPVWWPATVRWQANYSVQRMKHEDVRKVHKALCRKLAASTDKSKDYAME